MGRINAAFPGQAPQRRHFDLKTRKVMPDAESCHAGAHAGIVASGNDGYVQSGSSASLMPMPSWA